MHLPRLDECTLVHRLHVCLQVERIRQELATQLALKLALTILPLLLRLAAMDTTLVEVHARNTLEDLLAELARDTEILGSSDDPVGAAVVTRET